MSARGDDMDEQAALAALTRMAVEMSRERGVPREGG